MSLEGGELWAEPPSKRECLLADSGELVKAEDALEDRGPVGVAHLEQHLEAALG